MHMKTKKMASRFYRRQYLDSGASASSPPSCLLIYGRLVEHASPLRPSLPASQLRHPRPGRRETRRPSPARPPRGQTRPFLPGALRISPSRLNIQKKYILKLNSFKFVSVAEKKAYSNTISLPQLYSNLERDEHDL